MVWNIKFTESRPLRIGLRFKQKGDWINESELRGKIKTEPVALRRKTNSYFTYDDIAQKKAEGTKVCVIERILKFNHYKDFLFNNNPILQYLNLQDLKVKHTMYILKKSTRLQ